jgi:O-antigen/teichoic acid export membrane protein
MAVSAFGISIYMYIGPTILRYVRPKEEVGLFSAGYKLISILTLIPAAVSQVVYPIFSQFAAQAPGKLQKSLQDAIRVMLEISVPLAVGTIVLAPRIMELIYPPAYAAGAIVLQVIIAGNAVGYLAWILTTFLLSIGRQSYCMLNSLTVAALVAVSSFLLIPPYGFVAVAAIIAVTEVLLFASLATYAWRQGYRSTSFASPLKILLASALMGLLLQVLSFLPLLVVVVCGVLVYGALILLLRVIGDQEREILSKILNLQVGKE